MNYEQASDAIGHRYNYTFLSSLSTEQELEALVAAVQDTQQEGPYQVFHMDVEMLTEFLRGFYLDHNKGSQFLLMAKDGDKVVGYVAAAMMDNHFMFANHGVAQIITWWVHPDHRKNGVAKELMLGVEMWAKQMNATYIMSGHYNNDTGKQVRKMYEGNGYNLIEYTYLKSLEIK